MLHDGMQEAATFGYNTIIQKDKNDDSFKEPCTFLPQDTSPLPTILISMGRSGSSITWQTISAILQNRNVAQELTGSTSKDTIAFFDSMERNPHVGFDWALQTLCYIQQHIDDVNSTNPGIAGFQWKPFKEGWNSTYGKGARRVIGQSDTPIKFIYLVRNPLDVKLSNLKHLTAKTKGDHLEAHCSIEDVTCVQNMVQHESGHVFPVGNALLLWLRKTKKKEINIENDLKRDNITFVKIDYGRLYDSVDDDDALAEEWMKVFRYLGRGPMQGLTMKTVKSYFAMASSHAKSRSEAISNYQEVVSTLIGTEYEYLLRE